MDEINTAAFMPAVLDADAANKPHFRLKDNIIENKFLKSTRFPILGGSVYNTTLKSYVGVPFYKTLGFSVLSHRLYEVCIAGVLLLCFQLVINKTLRDRAITCIVTSCFASDPLFIFQTKSQAFSFVFLLALVFIFYYTLIRVRDFEETPQRRAFIVMGLAAGGASITYFTSLATLTIPMGIGLLLAIRKKCVFYLLIPYLFAVSLFIYGIASVKIQTPSRLSNLGMPNFAISAQNRLSESIIDKIVSALSELQSYLHTSGPLQHTGVDALSHTWGKVMILFLAISIAGLTTCYLIAKRRKEISQIQNFLFSVGPIFSFLGLSSLFASIHYHHLFSILPFAYLCLGLATSVIVAIPFFKGSKILKLISLTPPTILLAINMLHQNVIDEALEKTGGVGLFNERISQIFPLASSLHPDEQLVFTDWGYHLTYLFVSGGQKNFDVRFAPPSKWLEQHLKDHERLFACSSAKTAKVLKAELERVGAEKVDQTPIYTRDGSLAYVFTFSIP